jgi:hypothetical protein
LSKQLQSWVSLISLSSSRMGGDERLIHYCAIIPKTWRFHSHFMIHPVNCFSQKNRWPLWPHWQIWPRMGMGCWRKTTRWIKMNELFGHKKMILSCSHHIKQTVFVTSHPFIFSCDKFKMIKCYVTF